MGIQKTGGTKIIPNHALDKVENPSEACLPPSRPSLTSYALEYGGALRIIRVSTPLVATWALPQCGVHSSLLEPSSVCFAMDKRI
jgi:hypothetical protein